MKRLTVIIAAIALSTPALARDPCATELCMSDYKSAKNLSMCKGPVEDFFKIKCKKHGKFNSACTYQERRDYLYDCDPGSKTDKERILAAFGMAPSQP